MLAKALLALIGLTSGIAVSAGIFAFIISLGFVERMAGATRTAPYIRLYETVILFGATAGNLVSIYHPRLPLGKGGAAIFGLFSGIFTGILAIALVEILQAVPILLRRVALRKGLGCVVLSLALGKMTGALIQFLRGWIS